MPDQLAEPGGTVARPHEGLADQDGVVARVGEPPGVGAVADARFGHGDDARRLADAGYDAILVGETLVKAADRAAALRTLIGHPVAPR